MLPLVIIKQKSNFQKWNIQKTIVCILGSSQRASFPKSAASEEAGQGPIPRVGAFLGPGKRPLGPCFLFLSLYVVENLSRFSPSESVFPHRRAGVTWEMIPAPSPNLISHSSKLAQLKAIEGLRQTKEGSAAQSPAWSYLGQGRTPAGPCAQGAIVHLVTRLWALLEAFGIKLPVINRHWLGFKGESSRPKVPEKYNASYKKVYNIAH